MSRFIRARVTIQIPQYIPPRQDRWTRLCGWTRQGRTVSLRATT